MRVIIAGSRTVVSYDLVKRCIERALTRNKHIIITEVVSGTARGVDTLGEEYARKHNITIKQFPADWNKHGKSAGYKRNEQMAHYADALIAIQHNESRGTAHMINIAKDQGLITAVILVI